MEGVGFVEYPSDRCPEIELDSGYRLDFYSTKAPRGSHNPSADPTVLRHSAHLKGSLRMKLQFNQTERCIQHISTLVLFGAQMGEMIPISELFLREVLLA